MTGMLASSLAAVIRVLRELHVPATSLRWPWPTLLGSPLIALWVAYYKRRFTWPRAPEAAA
jgi:hypothetical protein